MVLEVLGWDEAFLAAGTGHGDLGDEVAVRAFADHVRSAVLAATRLHCSVGIGNNKLQVAEIDAAPAGGSDVLVVALIVFLVLLFTDIMGYTKIFPFTRSAK